MPQFEELAIVQGPTDPELIGSNIGQLLDEQTKIRGSNASLVSTSQGIRLNFNELRERCRRTAANLLRLGLQPGHRVVLLLGNSAEFVELFLAIGAVGATVVLLNLTFSTKDAIQAIELADPWAVVIARRIGFHNNDDLVGHLVKKLGCRKKLQSQSIDKFAFALFKGQVGVTWINSFDDAVDVSLAKYWAQNSQNDTCCFQFTSGTTGQRKASMLTQRSLINNAYLVGKRLELTENDAVCGILPLGHCFGLVCGLLAALIYGGKFVLPSEVFNPAAVCRSLEEEKCTVAHAVPAMFEAMIKIRQNSKKPAKFALRTGIIAGSQPSISLLEDIQKYFGLASLIYPFGMTELSAVGFATSMEHDLRKDNRTVGRPLAHTFAKVVDEKGQIIRCGEVGELCVAGYLVHHGYFRNPGKTQESMHTDINGRQWLQTGDLVTIDTDGCCRVVGRVKDMIKKGGENITPQDIEDILVLHPDIERAAVVGIAEEKWGESIVAFFQTTSGSSQDEKALKRWLRGQKLSPHKMPDYFLRIGPGQKVQEMPISYTGKVLKMQLRAAAQNMLFPEM